MTITNEAKNILEGILSSNNNNCLKGTLQQSCCGTSLVFNLAKLKDDDEPVSINDIPVVMDDTVKERAETISISVKNGELIIQDTAASESC